MNYREFVLKMINPAVPLDGYGLNAAMGVAGEAGEFLELYKKDRFHGKPLDNEKAILELGDVLFYAELAAFALGVEVEDVKRANVDKLMKRYPEGFK